MSIDYSTIGKRIQIMRKKREITQEAMAEKLNVSVGYVSQIERGITKPNLNMLSEISVLLDTDISLLLTGTETNEKVYLSTEFLQKFETLSVKEKNVVMSLIDALLQNR